MIPAVAWSQDKPAPSQVRSIFLVYQQLGLSIEALVLYYEARITELERKCGEACK
jgi:hypothetical protein